MGQIEYTSWADSIWETLYQIETDVKTTIPMEDNEIFSPQ